MTANPLLTPKELAEAIGTSESSLRRWVDAGDIRMTRTAGGHRRIPLPEAIQFIRKIGATVIRPDILGLGLLSGSDAALPSATDEQKLYLALLAGARATARGLILSWYMQGKSLAMIFDGAMRSAMHRIGEIWQHDQRGILVEHRATEICIEAVAVLRNLIPPAPEEAPLALGAGAAGDPYVLPSMMAGAVLAETGFREVNYGPNTPIELLAREAIEREAQLVWLSLSAPVDTKAMRATITELHRSLQSHQIALVVGGRRAAEVAPPEQTVGTMSELAGFARGIKVSSASASA